MPSDELSLGEGDTPVLALPSLARAWGLAEIAVKAEWRNPTGSYKDRIALETMRHALHSGARGWIGTSSGNGGAAMAAYGARAGLPGFLCVAADAPKEKLQSIIPYGVTLMPMSQLGTAEMDEIADIAEVHRLTLAITAYRYNPQGMAGATAIGTELVDQRPCTHVYVPTGGGGLLTAVAHGLGAASTDAPAVVCAQPSGCAPIARYVEGEIETPQVAACDTTVSGLQLPDPPDGDVAAAATSASGGWGCAVADEDTWEAQRMLARHEGIFVEPAAALAIAAIAHDRRLGRLTDADRPLAVLTGSGLKDLRRFPLDEATHRTPRPLDDLRAIIAARLP